ncbi:MAG: enoyl-CoA hydratase-related protein [Myxococcota bacterium]
MAEPVLRDLTDGVLLLTLNRPEKKNAFDDPQWDGLRDALNDARQDPAVAVVVLTGAGADFSTGQDLGAFGASAEPRPDGRPSGFYGCAEAVAAFDKPLVGAAKGLCVGGGATILFHCDVLYLGESARLRLPFVSLGLVPEFASSYLLQQILGSRQAAELFYTAEWIDAKRALEVGLPTAVLPDADLLETALAKAREIARWPVASLQATKRTLLRAHRAGVEGAFEAENAGMEAMAGSPENVEAIRAFLEKREPDFAQFRKR